MPLTTDAAVLVETGAPLELMPLELPDLQPGQVLVEVAYSGVCHSQLHEVRGRRGPDRFLPHTLGHEGAGTVLAVGEGVRKVSPGDRVVLSWLKGAGADVPQTRYRSAAGPINSGAISTFMRVTITCENRVTVIPSELPLAEAALLGCAIPTGAGVVLNSLRARPGDAIAIFGVGGIGLSALLAARLLSLSPLIAVDIRDEKLETARSLGATHTINALNSDPVAAIREYTGGAGVAYAIEAAGQPRSMQQAFDSVRDGDGRCVLAGNLSAGQRMELDPMGLIRGKQIVGTWGGETRPDRDIPIYARLFAEGKLPLRELITAVYPLEQINDALDALEQGRVARALVRMGEASA